MKEILEKYLALIDLHESIRKQVAAFVKELEDGHDEN